MPFLLDYDDGRWNTMPRCAYRGHGRRGSRGIGRSYAEPRFQQRTQPLLRTSEHWRNWTELSVWVRGFPDGTETLELFHLLEALGQISRIELREDSRGKKLSEAEVTFCPPPPLAFWENWRLEGADPEWANLTIALAKQKRPFVCSIHPGKSYPEHMTIVPCCLDFGIMYDQEKMMVMQSVSHGLCMLLNLLRREVVIHFSMLVTYSDSRRTVTGFSSSSDSGSSQQDESSVEHFKLQIPLQQLDTIFEMEVGSNQTALLLPLAAPPPFFRRSHNLDATHDGSRHWNERKCWARQTDVVPNRHALAHTPVMLRNEDATLDVGRWTTYRLVFNNPKHNRAYNQIKEALNDYNVKIHDPGIFNLMPRQDAPLWNWIHKSSHAVNSEVNSLLADLATDVWHLSWPVRYQLEACISQGCIHEQNITLGFIQRLASMSDREALSKLEYAAEKKQRFFDPNVILSLNVPFPSYSRALPKHCSLTRSATITPSTVYYSSPTVEMSNRILRQYKEQEDRFLRVRFTDEKLEGRIHASDDDIQDAVFTRIFRCLKNGIMIGDRHYEFLAMGNSQFREHGAYFFSSVPSITAAQIREQMGAFDSIKIVSRWASRLGQCFSTTRAIRATRVKLVKIEDVERNGYNFTDGVGKISKFVAQIISNELGLPNPFYDPASAYQFRLGGIKGVLAIAPEATSNEIHIRHSQWKFSAENQGLEIIRCASFTTAILNRQLIAILTRLGIQDSVLLRMMEKELYELNSAMKDERVALRKLQERIDFHQMTLTIASILLDGFMTVQDPFAVSILHLWRAWVTKALKEKAGLPVKDAAFVLGCTDETATLRGHFEKLQSTDFNSQECRMNALPEIFIQVDSKKTGNYQIIDQICLVASHPSLHPGDVRVVRAVNVPALHHLKNVVVFPQLGDRDIPNMCSGGDLDGDDFIVIWDKEFIPPVASWNVRAMDFTAPIPEQLNRLVTIDDVVPFFVNYMKTDTLGKIANSHLANADFQPEGVNSKQCLALAELHSIAVDFPKSGIPAKMHHSLRPRKYPHFMQSRYRSKDKTYHSTTILGQLYDAVTDVGFIPWLHLPFDQRILDAYRLDDEILQKASEIKFEYDASMRRIMAQHEIGTEFEVWTTFVLKHARLSNDFKFHEVIGRLAESLKERFQHICYEKAGGNDARTILPFVAAMYTVTAREISAAIESIAQVSSSTNVPEVSSKDMPFISFPWLFQKELGMIASGKVFGSGESIKAEQRVAKHHTKFVNQLISVDEEQDAIETVQGIVRRGELLDLFDEVNDHNAAVDNSMHVPPPPPEEPTVSAQELHKFDELANNEDDDDNDEFMSVDEGVDLQPQREDVAMGDVVAEPPVAQIGVEDEYMDDLEEGEVVEMDANTGPSALEHLMQMLE